MGSTIVRALAAQIDATVERCAAPRGGTIVTMRLPCYTGAPQRVKLGTEKRPLFGPESASRARRPGSRSAFGLGQLSALREAACGLQATWKIRVTDATARVALMALSVDMVRGRSPRVSTRLA